MGSQTDSRRALGAWGEERAAAHLQERGWRILERNVRAGGVEIDLVARRKGIVAFVEVKTRRNRWAGRPEEAVDERKQARLIRGAAAWLHTASVRARCVRFDVICVEPDGKSGWCVRHLPGAFDAGG